MIIMNNYFITPILNEALDVNAHNREEQRILKHPREEKWAVKVCSDNKFVMAKLKGIVVGSLPDEWSE
jgi:hypothetical protein